MLKAITAYFECDYCGSEIEQRIEPAYKPPKGWCIFEVAEDAVKSSHLYSVKKGKHLCKACTERAKK